MTTRRERVVLELEDQFTAGAIKAASALALIKREANSLNGAGAGLDRTVKSTGDLGTSAERAAKKVKELTLEQAVAVERAKRMEKALRDEAKAAVDAEMGLGRLSDEAVRGGKDIDRYSGRLRLLLDAIVLLGPAALTVGSGLGGMAVGAGVAGLALFGLGDTLKALNDYQLEPTAEHLATLNQELAKAGPAGADFVYYLDSLEPRLRDLQNVARAGFLPGLTEGIESLMTRFPEVREIVADLAGEMGDLAARGGEWLAGPGFEDFKAFLAYAQQVGPDVANFALALASSLAGIAKAAAPIGQVTLPVLTKLLDVIAAIANSPLGTPLLGAVTAFLAINRATSLVETGLSALSSTSVEAQRNLAGIGKGIEFGAALLAINQLDKAMDNLLNTRVDQSALSRNLEALASGGKFKGNLDQIAHDVSRVNAALLSSADKVLGWVPGDPAGMDDARDNIQAVDDALAQMVESGNADTAAAAFKRLYDSARDLGISQADIRKEFPQYATAVENAGKASGDAAAATDAYGSALDAAAPPAVGLGEQVDAAAEAMRNQRSAALSAFDATTQYGQALEVARAAAAKGKRGIDANTEAGRENRQALSALAAAWNNQSDAVKNNSARFRQARSAFIETAVAMGVPIERARALAKQLMDIPKSRFIKVSAETKQAASEIQHILDLVASVHGKKIDIIANYIQRGNKIAAGSAGPGVGQRADGGPVPKTGLPYADRHPYLLADGEFVVSNRRGQVDRNLGLLWAINAGRLADGGQARPGVTRIEKASHPKRGDDIAYIERVAGGYFIELLNGAAFKVSKEALHGFDGWRKALRTMRDNMHDAGHIAEMNVRQIRRLSDAFDDLGSRRLKKLAAALDKAADLQEKQTNAARDAFEQVQSERASKASDIAQSLTRDLWGGGDTSAFSGGFAANSIAGANAQLQKQISDSQEFQRIEQALRSRGVSGGALEEILSGGIDRARAAASSSDADLRRYQSLYDTAQRYTASAANTGAALLTPAFDALKAKYEQEVAESRAIKEELRQLRAEQKQRHAEGQKTAQAAPKKTAAALNHGARKAKRG